MEDAGRTIRHAVAAAAAAAVAAVFVYRKFSRAHGGPAVETSSTVIRNRVSASVDPKQLRLTEKGTAFIFGLGFTGSRLARVLVAQGWRVIGTCRSEGSAQEHRAAGIEVWVFWPPYEHVHLFNLQKNKRYAHCVGWVGQPLF